MQNVRLSEQPTEIKLFFAPFLAKLLHDKQKVPEDHFQWYYTLFFFKMTSYCFFPFYSTLPVTFIQIFNLLFRKLRELILTSTPKVKQRVNVTSLQKRLPGCVIEEWILINLAITSLCDRNAKVLAWYQVVRTWKTSKENKNKKGDTLKLKEISHLQSASLSNLAVA